MTRMAPSKEFLQSGLLSTLVVTTKPFVMEQHQLASNNSITAFNGLKVSSIVLNKKKNRHNKSGPDWKHFEGDEAHAWHETVLTANQQYSLHWSALSKNLISNFLLDKTTLLHEL